VQDWQGIYSQIVYYLAYQNSMLPVPAQVCIESVGLNNDVMSST
jgi:hypothetical protein